MPCKVCGDTNTVRSHLLPKSFVHDVKAGARKAFAGSIRKKGIEFLQGGEFDDDLLCHSHEHSLKDSDDYAVRWVRSFQTKAKPIFGGKAFLLPNRRPDLLLKFVCSTVWRHAASCRYSTEELDLGPWERPLRRLIFENGSYDPQFMICRRDLTLGGKPFDHPILIPPHLHEHWGRRGYEFELGGLIWTLKLDDRSKGKLPDGLAGNGQDPIPVLQLPDLPAQNRTGFIENFRNMGETLAKMEE